jgi:biopolymer transport protein ExbD
VLEIVVQAVYFFHPLVWLLNRRTSAYREMACDDASIATNRIAPHEYSRQLLHIAESAAGSSSGFRAAAALFGSRSELLRRIRYQMKEGKMPQLTKRTGRLLIAALIVSILPLSWYCGEAKTGADQACNAHKAVANLPDGFDIIEVSVCRQRIEVDGKPTKLINLAAELEKKAEMPDSTIIVLKGDGKARMGLMHDIQVVLVDLGLVKVVYAGLSGEGLPLKLPVLKDADRLASLPEHNLAVIHLDGSGAVTLRGARIERENLRVRVEDELKENEFVVFSIQPAGDALFDDFLEVLAETKAGGASRIAVEKPI